MQDSNLSVLMIVVVVLASIAGLLSFENALLLVLMNMAAMMANNSKEA
jgi:hypothetical protein